MNLNIILTGGTWMAKKPHGDIRPERNITLRHVRRREQTRVVHFSSSIWSCWPAWWTTSFFGATRLSCVGLWLCGDISDSSPAPWSRDADPKKTLQICVFVCLKGGPVVGLPDCELIAFKCGLFFCPCGCKYSVRVWFSHDLAVNNNRSVCARNKSCMSAFSWIIVCRYLCLCVYEKDTRSLVLPWNCSHYVD